MLDSSNMSLRHNKFVIPLANIYRLRNLSIIGLTFGYEMHLSVTKGERGQQEASRSVAFDR